MSLTKSPPLVYGAPPRVNLLPPRELERRNEASLARRWGAIAVAAVVVMALAVLGAAVLEHSASNDLSGEQARTTALATQLATYKDVSAAIHDQSAYTSYRGQAMTSDVSWKSVIGALQASLPTGVGIDGFDAVVGAGTSPSAGTSGSAAAGGSAGATGGAALAAATAPSGTMVTATVQVTSMQPVNQTAMVTSFSKVHGVLAVDMSSLSSASSVSYTSTVAVYFDRSVLSNRFAEAAK